MFCLTLSSKIYRSSSKIEVNQSMKYIARLIEIN